MPALLTAWLHKWVFEGLFQKQSDDPINLRLANSYTDNMKDLYAD